MAMTPRRLAEINAYCNRPDNNAHSIWMALECVAEIDRLKALIYAAIHDGGTSLLLDELLDESEREHLAAIARGGT